MIQVSNPCKMITIRILAAVFVMTANVGSVASYIEQCISEYCFSTPGSDVIRTFDGAKTWCEANSSQLAVVTNNLTQEKLAQFLSLYSSQLNSPMFINVRLDQKQKNTWFLVNGAKYLGGISNQGNDDYRLYCYLSYDSFSFQVYASHPNDTRSYICEFKDTSWCSNSSTTNYLYNRRCYVRYDSETLTWYQARQRCYTNGGDLATFNYGTDRDYTITYSAPFNPSWLTQPKSYWVGIRWDDWTWKSPGNGNETIYTAWSKEKPNNFSYECVCVDPSGIPTSSWKDCRCNSEAEFVCLKLVPTTTAITTTSTSTTTIRSTPVVTTTKTTSSPISKTTTNSTAKEPPQPILAIALGAGIGGGVFLILLVLIAVVVVIIIRKRTSKNTNGGSDSRDKMKSKSIGKTKKNKHIDTVESAAGDVYATVVPTPRQHGQKETPRDIIIYSTPEFAESSTSTPSNSNYEEATRVIENSTVENSS